MPAAKKTAEGAKAQQASKSRARTSATSSTRAHEKATRDGRPARRSNSRRKPGQDIGRVEVVGFELHRNLINVLGEEHYPYAEYLYHELAANAWDEDAAEVQIVEETVRAGGRAGPAIYNITISDDGNGMDFARLQEYFRVGESGKPQRQTSERFGRPLIGRIGVGKVAILKAARAWTVTTERHLGLDEPVRLTVHVDVDQWISGELAAFAVRYLEPTGRPGTEIVLESVTTRFREDRILRHIQRLPLGDDFRVWRNGEPVPPRQWHGIDKIDIDEDVTWEEGELKKSGRIRGEIWIRPESKKKRDQAYLKEPKTEREGLSRDPAGLEVRVNRDMITRDFFGHESHGHQVNRIWGWVEAPWLPIVGNRTDFQRNTPAGHAFYEAVKEHFDAAFRRVRYEQDQRAQRNRRNKGQDDTASEEQADAEVQDPEPEEDVLEHEQLASRFGEVLNQVLADHPEFAPVVQSEARSGRGRPAKNRIYPVRPSGERRPFETDVYGDAVAIRSESRMQETTLVQPGSVRRAETKQTEELELGNVTVNTQAGIKLQFRSLGALEAPYRWDLDDPEKLALDINTDHKLYEQADRGGTALHRLHCAWLVAMALAERSFRVTGPQVADTAERLSYELFTGWGARRSG